MVIIHAGKTPAINITRGQLFAALASEVAAKEEIVRNSSQYWSDIDTSLSMHRILVMAPKPNTTAALVFYERVMAEGCKDYKLITELEKDDQQRICRSLRGGDHVVNAAKREESVIEWLEDNKNSYAITNYSTYLDYSDKLHVNSIDGLEPYQETIANKRYPLVNGMILYVKDQHINLLSGLQQFLYELTSERALSPDGYMAERGLNTLDEISRNKARNTALEFGL